MSKPHTFHNRAFHHLHKSPISCAEMPGMDFCIIQHLRPFMCCWPFAELWLEEPLPPPRKRHKKKRSHRKHTSEKRVKVKVSESSDLSSFLPFWVCHGEAGL